MSVSSMSSIASVTSTSTSKLLHKSYTVTELFNFLVDPPSTDYVKTFLLTYHLFTNATEVMDALIEAHQYWLSSPQGSEVCNSYTFLHIVFTVCVHWNVECTAKWNSTRMCL